MAPNDFVMPYDKHKGKTLAQILTVDRAYIEWLAVNMVPRTDSGREIKAMAAAVLANGKQVKPTASNGQNSGKMPSTATTGAEEQTPARTRIYSEITRSVILHAEDALDIGKVRIFLLSYQRGQGASATAAHYLDLEDARVLAADLASGRLTEKFTDFKGSANTNGSGDNTAKPVSRVLKLEDRGDKQRAPIVLQVANGPGQVVGEGAVKPAGKPDVEIAILLTRWQARRFGHALQSYLLAYQIRNARMTLYEWLMLFVSFSSFVAFPLSRMPTSPSVEFGMRLFAVHARITPNLLTYFVNDLRITQ